MITFNNIVTILHKENNVWQKKVYNNASWHENRSKNQSNNTSSINNTVVCRILKKEPLLCNVGDYVVKGIVKEEVSNILELVEKYRPVVFKVMSYTDNTDKPLAHYRLEG